jgi:small subunit ribosomal protein S2
MNQENKLLNFYSLNLQLSVEQLLLVNAHLGHTRKFLNIKIKPYLMGQRANIYLINVSHTAHQCKIFLNVLINLFSLRKKLLIIKDFAFFDFKSIMLNSRIYYYDKKWIGGLLTNFKKVRRNSKFIKSKNTLRNLKSLPSMVFFLDINFSYWAVLEAVNLDIPISAIIDTNTNSIDNINYPIASNNKSFEVNLLFLHMIKNALLKGEQKEVSKILHII